MALYQGKRDQSLFRHLSKEVVDRQIAEEVGYYKFSLAETKYNIYGESKHKMYYEPVLLTCLYEVQDQVASDDTEYGSERTQLVDFRFLRYDLQNIGLLPEEGDIIMWQESYYEVDNVIENQRVGGKDPDYALESDLQNFGESWSMICKTHLTRRNKLNLVVSR